MSSVVKFVTTIDPVNNSISPVYIFGTACKNGPPVAGLATAPNLFRKPIFNLLCAIARLNDGVSWIWNIGNNTKF